MQCSKHRTGQLIPITGGARRAERSYFFNNLKKKTEHMRPAADLGDTCNSLYIQAMHPSSTQFSLRGRPI